LCEANALGYQGGMTPRTPSPTALSDNDWDVITPLVPAAKPGGRPEKYPTRELLDALFYILRGGCAWRLLPPDFPPWQLVDPYGWRWRHEGPWQRLHDRLRGNGRVAAGQRRHPRAGIIDRPSVKTTAQGGSGAMTRASKSKGVSGSASLTPAD
jgi:putative transposase